MRRLLFKLKMRLAFMRGAFFDDFYRLHEMAAGLEDGVERGRDDAEERKTL